jgi:hypothetical protein
VTVGVTITLFLAIEPAEHGADLVSSLLLHRWQHVGIGIERQLNAGVAQAFLTTFGCTPALSNNVAHVCRSE